MYHAEHSVFRNFSLVLHCVHHGSDTPPPPCPSLQEGWRAVSPSGSRLVRGDQGAAGSLGAPLP